MSDSNEIKSENFASWEKGWRLRRYNDTQVDSIIRFDDMETHKFKIWFEKDFIEGIKKIPTIENSPLLDELVEKEYKKIFKK